MQSAGQYRLRNALSKVSKFAIVISVAGWLGMVLALVTR